MGETNILFNAGRLFGQHFTSVLLFLPEWGRRIEAEQWGQRRAVVEHLNTIHLVCKDARISKISSGKWLKNYPASTLHKKPASKPGDTKSKSLGLRTW